MRISILIFTLCFSSMTLAQVSAKRLPHEHYLQKVKVSYGEASSESAYNAASSFSDLDFEAVPEWPNFEIMNDRFNKLRDLRFIDVDENSDDDPIRRISWLYPDDGCCARAGPTSS